MEKEKNTPLINFEFEGTILKVSYIETMKVAEGVTCDVYRFDDDGTKDLGIIRISSGCKTPLQKIIKGNRTVEGYVSGDGKLIVSGNGDEKVYKTIKGEKLQVDVKIGETMQWQAGEEDLFVYEICFPPYEDGRYENLQ